MHIHAYIHAYICICLYIYNLKLEAKIILHLYPSEEIKSRGDPQEEDMLSRSSSSSSSGNNYSAPSPLAASWRFPRDYGASTPNSNESNSGQHLSGLRSLRFNPDSRGAMEPQRSFGRRTSSFGSDSYPAPQLPSVQIVILDTERPRESNPLSRQIPREATPRPVDRWDGHYQRSSSHGEQNKALENLRKDVYNPNSKRITNRINLYYRDTPVNPIDNEEERKRCAICLEDFERGQEVMVTPCKHVFHEECIVPWAKSNAQCPVCRFVFGPKTRERPTPFISNNNNSNFASVVPAGLSPQEFLSIVTALGDGIRWAY